MSEIPRNFSNDLSNPLFARAQSTKVLASVLCVVVGWKSIECMISCSPGYASTEAGKPSNRPDGVTGEGSDLFEVPLEPDLV